MDPCTLGHLPDQIWSLVGACIITFLFAIYLDDIPILRSLLPRSFVVLLYADYILLIAFSISALQELFDVCAIELSWLDMNINGTRSPATAGTANRSLLFLEHRIPMPELFTELRFSILREFWTQEIRFPLLGGDAPRLG